VVVKGAAITFVGFLVGKIFAYIYSIFLARTLGPEELGIFMLATGILGFVIMFANLGLPYGIMRYIAFYKSQGKEGKVKGTILSGIMINIVASVFFSLLLFLLSDYIGITIYNMPKLSVVLKIFSAIVPLGTIVTTLLLSIQGFKQIKYKVYVRSFIEIPLKILFYLTLFLLGFRLRGAAIGLVLSYIVSVIISFYFLERKVYPFIRTAIKPKYNFNQLLSFSWPLLAATLFSMLLTSVDSFMLGYLINASAVGIYGIAETLARLGGLAYNSIGVLFLPIASGYFALKKTKEMSLFFKTVTRWMFAMSLPLLLLLVVFSVPFIQVFYGEDYVSGYATLAILSSGFFIVAAVGPTQDLLRAIGKPRYELLNTVVSALTNIALNWILIPTYGIVGAAIATSISYALWNALSLIEIYAIARIHPYNRGYLKPLAAGLLSILPIYLIKQQAVPVELLQFPFNFLLLAFFAASFLAIYTLLFVVLRGLQKEDLVILRALENKTGLRIRFARDFIKRFI
jgi:O-antigen/teichoic acid export membrane protein